MYPSRETPSSDATTIRVMEGGTKLHEIGRKGGFRAGDQPRDRGVRLGLFALRDECCGAVVSNLLQGSVANKAHDLESKDAANTTRSR